MTSPAEVRESCKVVDAELDLVMSSDPIRRANWSPSSQVAEHLRNCERCRNLYQFLIAPVSGPRSFPQLESDVQERLKQSLRPVAPQASPGVLAAQFLMAFFLFAAPLIGIMGSAGYLEMNVTQLAGIGTVLIAGAALLSMSLAWQMSPGSLQNVPPRVAVTTLVAGFLFGAALLFPWKRPEAFFSRGLTCLGAGLLMAAPAAILFGLLLRRGHTFASGVLGATVGAISGLMGASVLQMHCSHQDAAHLLVWHGGLVVISIALGGLLVRMVAWRSSEAARHER